MTDRYTKAVLTFVAAAAVAIAVKQIAAPVSGTMPPPQTNPAPQTSPPAPGPAYPPSHPVIGAPRAFGQVVTSQPEGSHVILSKNVVSVLHPSPGAFCIVLTPEILAYEAVMVATLRLPLIYLPRYSISHIETKSDCALSERRAGRDGEPVGAASSRADRHAGGPAQAARGLFPTLLRRRWRPDLLRG